jgi:hypothetical protein
MTKQQEDAEKLATVREQLAAIEVEMRTLEVGIRTLCDKRLELWKDERRLVALTTLAVGQSVRLAYTSGHKLDQATGTLLVLRRTRALVDFSPHGEWSIPLEQLIPSGAAQGFTPGKSHLR